MTTTKFPYHTTPGFGAICFEPLVVDQWDAKTKLPTRAKCEGCGREVSELNLHFYNLTNEKYDA